MGTFEVAINVFCIMIWPEAWVCQGVEDDGLNENIPIRSFGHFIPSWQNCLGRIRKCGNVGRVLLLGVGFEVSKNLDHFQCATCVLAFNLRFELLPVSATVLSTHHHGIYTSGMLSLIKPLI